MVAIQFGGLALLIFLDQLGSHPITESVLVASLIYLAMWALQAVFNIFVLLSKANKSILTDYVVELKDTGIIENTKYFNHQFFWPCIVKGKVSFGHIAIYVAQHQAIIIPNRAFDSKEHKTEFLNFLGQQLDNA